MSKLSGFPTGLLDLLGSQNFGEAPRDLGDVIVPIVDVTTLFGLTKQVASINIMAAPANGTNAGGGLIVPKGEVWQVNAGGLFVSTGVGVTGDFTPTVVTFGLTVPVGSTTSLLASQTRWLLATQAPFFLKAGDELTVYISALVGAPQVVQQYMLTRFRA